MSEEKQPYADFYANVAELERLLTLLEAAIQGLSLSAELPGAIQAALEEVRNIKVTADTKRIANIGEARAAFDSINKTIGPVTSKIAWKNGTTELAYNLLVARDRLSRSVHDYKSDASTAIIAQAVLLGGSGKASRKPRS